MQWYLWRPSAPMEEFNTSILDSSLVDAGFEGSLFTWMNSTIWKRLDRVFISVDWGDFFSSIWVEHLAHSFSDHCPSFDLCPCFYPGSELFPFPEHVDSTPRLSANY